MWRHNLTSVQIVAMKGLLSFTDPIRPSVANAVRQCTELGIKLNLWLCPFGRFRIYDQSSGGSYATGLAKHLHNYTNH